MNISSVVVRVRPERLDEVRARLATLAGHQIHAVIPDGRLIVTLEDSDAGSAADSYVALNAVPGVLNATLIYQYGDDDLLPPDQDIPFELKEEV